MPPTPIISVKNLTVRYEDTQAIEDVTFDVCEGDYTAVIGPNGAGKSTIMKAIMGLVNPQRGSVITVHGGLKRLGYVPQHNAVDWSFPVSVRDVVMMGLVRQIGWFRRANREHQEQVDRALTQVGLSHHAHRQIGDLSGGQKRRVFMARALAQRADVLLLDEPFAGVDIGAQNELMDLIDALNANGITILLSTHDLNLAFSRFKTVLAIHHHLIAYGNPKAVYVPDTLRALYGGRLATWQESDQTMIFVDETTTH